MATRSDRGGSRAWHHCSRPACDDADRIERGGAGTSSDNGHAPASVTGLVPDRVAQVIPVYLDRPSCIVPIRYNIFAYTVDHTAPNASPYRII